MSWMLASVLAYVGLQLVFGFVVSRRIHTEADYLVAGRSLGAGLTTFSVFATWFGAETCIGAAGQAYGAGLSGVTADPFGYAVCLLFMGAVFATPLWRRKLTTLADLFRDRYGPAAERLAVLLMVPTSVMWAGAQIRAFGQILGATSGLSLETTIAIAASVVIAYTALGGMLADALSDVIQGIVMLAGLLLILAMMWTSGELAGVADLPARALSLREPGVSALETAERWAVPIMGSVVAQELVARVVSARSASIARTASLTAGGLYLAVGSIPVLVGLVASRVAPGLEHDEQVLVHQAARYLPPVLHVIFTGALVSAILSTVDSALLVAGALIGHNLILPLWPSLDERAKVRINRACVVAFGVLAYALARSAEGVYALVEEASALGSAGVFVCVVFGLFSSLGGRFAAGSCLLSALAVYVLGAHVWTWPQPYLASVATAVTVFLLGSLIDRRQARLA